jgi:hypothetical protein
MVHEVNENRRNIIEMKSEMGLPCDPHHELLEFDDHFAEWDAQDAQATRGEEKDVVPAPALATARISTRRSRHTRDDDEEIKED